MFFLNTERCSHHPSLSVAALAGPPEITFGDEVVILGKQGKVEMNLDEYSKTSDSPGWDEMSTSIGNQTPKCVVYHPNRHTARRCGGEHRGPSSLAHCSFASERE